MKSLACNKGRCIWTESCSAYQLLWLVLMDFPHCLYLNAGRGASNRAEYLHQNYCLSQFIIIQAHSNLFDICIRSQVVNKDVWGSGCIDPLFLTSALVGGEWSLPHNAQNGSGAHLASCSIGNREDFPGSKRPGREADHSPPSSA
jgi:hypothetical protein